MKCINSTSRNRTYATNILTPEIISVSNAGSHTGFLLIRGLRNYK